MRSSRHQAEDHGGRCSKAGLSRVTFESFENRMQVNKAVNFLCRLKAILEASCAHFAGCRSLSRPFRRCYREHVFRHWLHRRDSDVITAGTKYRLCLHVDVDEPGTLDDDFHACCWMPPSYPRGLRELCVLWRVLWNSLALLPRCCYAISDSL